MKYHLFIGATAILFSLSACDVNQTSEGEAPELDVDVSGESGALPSFNVNWADVDVATRTKTVEVPKLVVVTEEKQVDVPVVDFDMPDDSGSAKAAKTERTVVVEAEIENQMHKLTIQRIFAKQRRLVVISTLEATGEQLEDQRVRVSDRLVLNAPEDLDVKHIIIGEKPAGDWNNQYVFVADRSAADARVKDATRIFSR